MTADPVVTVAQMRAAEQDAMDAGTSEWELMQRAGRGAAQWVARMAAGRAVTVLCGPGNNGGDGYVIAEKLRREGQAVTVIAPVPPKSKAACEARAAYQGDVPTAGPPLSPVVVDCLFGNGLDREIEPPFAELLEDLARTDCFRIAIDIPSGIASDSGARMGPVPRYDLTLALGAFKQAHFLMPAMAEMGIARLLPIGLQFPSEIACLSQRPRFSPPDPSSHKYRRGLLAIVAGAMPGAALLAAQAAMRAGAGYVKLASEHSHPDAPAELVIEEGGLEDALADRRIGALLVGPGLGRDDGARSRLEATLATGRPTVLDADALHLLCPEFLRGLKGGMICVTPHEGELATLCDNFGIVAESKIERASALHRVSGMAVLAKGPDTILVGSEGTRFFPRGSSWLSTAGTGDVLAGMIASRLAHHRDPARACEEGVWLHHEAARIAGAAFTAGDLAHATSAAVEALS